MEEYKTDGMWGWRSMVATQPPAGGRRDRSPRLRNGVASCPSVSLPIACVIASKASFVRVSRFVARNGITYLLLYPSFSFSFPGDSSPVVSLRNRSPLRRAFHAVTDSHSNGAMRRQPSKEMLSLNGDVCLQELDNYDEWWRGKMGLAGYDGVYLRHQGENDGMDSPYFTSVTSFSSSASSLLQRYSEPSPTRRGL